MYITIFCMLWLLVQLCLKSYMHVCMYVCMYINTIVSLLMRRVFLLFGVYTFNRNVSMCVCMPQRTCLYMNMSAHTRTCDVFPFLLMPALCLECPT